MTTTHATRYCAELSARTNSKHSPKLPGAGVIPQDCGRRATSATHFGEMLFMSNTSAETQANPADLATSATGLMAMVENGEAAQAVARIQTLSQRDFIRVWRSAQTLEKALTKFALSWQGAEYWGDGKPWPDEQKAQAAAAG